MSTRILYVEDEVNLGTIVSETLRKKGYAVCLVKDGAHVLQEMRRFQADLCVLDVMLPHVDGFSIGKELRSVYPALPIIFLTAKTQAEDVVKGFGSGGTDYMRKPFSMEELAARIENQLNLNKTKQAETDEKITLGKYTFSALHSSLEYEGKITQLSHRETEILLVLSRNVNQIVDRRMLLMEVWGDDSYFHSRNLDVYMRKLRSYFAEDPQIEILTLKGKGYRFITEK
ncbi:MAG: response regulator transcription factor [Chitinophagales bacterium]